ncbi:DUF2971 domain-containing protein [Paenibacillus puldeungensis]|uniref:DUF2971 domain-containing protein n=1 Tax=Paenibacillus puldeungensis TaxID=696536 RepID=A0ABW3RU17_9BACL
MNTPLYHYCSGETFLNIIKNKTIRLSDISKSNDYIETKWLIEYIEEEIIRQYKEEPFFKGQLIYGLDETTTLELIIKSIKERTLERSEALFYAACFSEEGDKLSQWRGYADDGYGLSIGFNSDSLKTLISKEESIKLLRVDYPDQNNNSYSAQIREHSKDIIESILYAIETGDTKKLFSGETYAIDIFHELSSRIFIQKSIKFKNPAFKEEAEWRIVFDDEIDKYANWEDWYDEVEDKSALQGEIATLFPNGLQFKAYRNKIVSFFDLSFKGYEESIVKEIVIGPKSDIQEGDIYQLLSYYGYEATDIKIIKSKSTYR